MKTKSELRSEAQGLDPVIRIGKNGLTDAVVLEIIKLLKKKRLIKIKFLRSFVEGNDRKKAASELAEKTGAVLVQLTGFVVVLYKGGIAEKVQETSPRNKIRS